ncbi:MAG: tRNA (N6-threonylcarbamoyladenosine(37)-N6)-methyltransferase TrmO [Clostridia bacterium]|nr:tRNA (N6-threonylcarbamoyladenosine(37)-N6)-methyltransferase TrmO [Clostridia bacterium]
MNELTIRPVTRIRCGWRSKFGIPRQSGLLSTNLGLIVFEEGFAREEALRGLEAFSHIWLIWGFSESPERGSLTVRPPRFGGNERLGVFATRSPVRPNPLGLSAVKLEGMVRLPQDGFHTKENPQTGRAEPEELPGLAALAQELGQDALCELSELLNDEELYGSSVLVVSGADLLDGTPIYDIKPYVPYADSIDASEGWAGKPEKKLTPVFAPGVGEKLTEWQRRRIEDVLAYDPRPAYQDDPARVYRFELGGLRVAFRADSKTATVTEAADLTEDNDLNKDRAR